MTLVLLYGLEVVVLVGFFDGLENGLLLLFVVLSEAVKHEYWGLVFSAKDLALKSLEQLSGNVVFLDLLN